MKWAIGTKIGGLLTFSITVLILFGIFLFLTIQGYIRSNNWTEHTYQVLNTQKEILSLLKDAETGQRGYIITGEERYLEPYNKGTSDVSKSIDDLLELTSDNPKQQQRIARLKPLIGDKFTELKQTIDLRTQKGFDAAREIVISDKGKKIMNEIRVVLSEMDEEESNLLKIRALQMKSDAQSTKMIIILGSSLGSLIILVLGVLIIRNISKPLNEGVSLLGSSANEILAATIQVASGTAETATAISETTTTVEEVQQAAKLSSEKAKNVANSAQQVVQVSQNGQKAVEETINGMNRIRVQMDSIAQTVVRLSEQSQSIGGIIASVTDIADQSNLLAVNAAIEAAKAGEQGKGFAVVASEIRELASQSKQATLQVRNILTDVQKSTSAAVMATEQGSKAVEAGVKQSVQAGEAIIKLAESSNEAVQAAIQIAASSQQQVLGIDQIVLAMQNIRQAGAETALSMVQAEKSAKKLTELGQKLKYLVDGFKV